MSPTTPNPGASSSPLFPDRYFLGLDLGQATDYAALVALRRRDVSQDPECSLYRYTVRGVRRWELGTPYTAVAEDVTRLVAGPPLAGCMLGLDATGVGAPVVEMIYRCGPQATIRPVLITSGHAVGGDTACYHVPKRDLVAAVNVLLQSDRLEIPASVPSALVLVKELQEFRARITAAGNETFAADWREKAHDDLVLALAIAAWLGEKSPDAWTGPLVLWPPHPEQVAAERNLDHAREALAQWKHTGLDRDRHEAVELALRVWRNPLAFDGIRHGAAAILTACSCPIPDPPAPASPATGHEDLADVDGMLVDFRERE